MKKLLNIFLTITIFLTLTGCSNTKESVTMQAAITFSDTSFCP